jgi:hypothetical protein
VTDLPLPLQGPPVERRGPTEAEAKDALKLALRDRARTATGINGDTRLREIGPEWLAGIGAAVKAGERSPSIAISTGASTRVGGRPPGR